MQGESLREAWERGRSAWPDVQLGEADFARLLAGRSPSAELYLACACVEGDPRALAALEAMLLPAVAPVLARLDADERDEIVQELRERLLVPRGGKPARIAGYSGRGPLENWLKVAGLREAIEVDRRRKRAPVSDEAALAGAPAM